MKPLAVLLCACLMATACASQRQQAETQPTLKRAKPLVAMGPSRQDQVADACRFSAGVWKMGLQDQAAFIRNCVEILGHNFRLEVADRQVLVRWIEAE